MGAIEEIADTIVYRCDKCWECIFAEEPFCRYYSRYFEYPQHDNDNKPEWCRVDRVKIEFRR